METPLKSCPFCGGEAEKNDDCDGNYSLGCENRKCIAYCIRTTIWWDDLDEAEVQWNARAKPSECERCDRIEKWTDHVGCTPSKAQRYEKLLSFVQVMATQLDDEQAKELLEEIGEYE